MNNTMVAAATILIKSASRALLAPELERPPRGGLSEIRKEQGADSKLIKLGSQLTKCTM
jgi:hypothetical protein